jgi:hypothetical protein
VAVFAPCVAIVVQRRVQERVRGPRGVAPGERRPRSCARPPAPGAFAWAGAADGHAEHPAVARHEARASSCCRSTPVTTGDRGGGSTDRRPRRAGVQAGRGRLLPRCYQKPAKRAYMRLLVVERIVGYSRL